MRALHKTVPQKVIQSKGLKKRQRDLNGNGINGKGIKGNGPIRKGPRKAQRAFAAYCWRSIPLLLPATKGFTACCARCFHPLRLDIA
jgi:hypothetical protein